MNSVSQQARETLDILRYAVTEELERKRRLGHYAVIWQNGQPVDIGGEHDPALLNAMKMPDVKS